jgi:hypothetical protein
MYLFLMIGMMRNVTDSLMNFRRQIGCIRLNNHRFSKLGSCILKSQQLVMSRSLTMKKGLGKDKYTKSNLPVKTCEYCQRPMEWRKSWAKNWESVKFCSDRCRSNAKRDKSHIKNYGNH